MNAGSYLARLVARDPMTAEELRALEARAWQEHGIVVARPYDPGEPLDDFQRQALKNLGARRHGRRMAGGAKR